MVLLLLKSFKEHYVPIIFIIVLKEKKESYQTSKRITSSGIHAYA